MTLKQTIFRSALLGGLAVFLLLTFSSFVNAQSRCGVGNSWHEKESGWTGVWTRTDSRCSDGYVFKAVWDYPDGRGVSWHNIQVYLQPNGLDLYVYRPECWYKGRIQSDGVTIHGTYG